MDRKFYKMIYDVIIKCIFFVVVENYFGLFFLKCYYFFLFECIWYKLILEKLSFYGKIVYDYENL